MDFKLVARELCPDVSGDGFRVNHGRTREAVEAALRRAYEAGAASAVPDGYVVVPVEPADSMLALGAARLAGVAVRGLAVNLADDVYRAMVGAASDTKEG